MTNLDSIFKSRDITLPTKGHLVKAMVFPVVMYGCERWTVKKAEHRRINAPELWHWRRLLRVPWTERRSNRSILKEISPKYFAQVPILRPPDVKCQYPIPRGAIPRRAKYHRGTLVQGSSIQDISPLNGRQHMLSLLRLS